MTRMLPMLAALALSRTKDEFDTLVITDGEQSYGDEWDDLVVFNDDESYGDDDDYGDDDYGDDGEFEGDDDYGARLSREERQERRRRKKGIKGQGRDARRGLREWTKEQRRDGDDQAGEISNPKAARMNAVKIVTGAVTLGAAGNGTIRIRAQEDYIIEDVAFAGLAASEVTSILNGPDTVLNEPDGVDISVFAAGSFMRGLLVGQAFDKGTDVVSSMVLPGAGTVTMILKCRYVARCG